MKNVNQPFRKKDAMQLVTGKPVYMDDLAPADCLIVKLLRSPHPNAIVKTINTTVAKKVPGIEAIFTWRMWIRMAAATPKRARPTPKPAPTTGWSLTAMFALWAMWSPSWPVWTIGAWTRP